MAPIVAFFQIRPCQLKERSLTELMLIALAVFGRLDDVLCEYLTRPFGVVFRGKWGTAVLK